MLAKVAARAPAASTNRRIVFNVFLPVIRGLLSLVATITARVSRSPSSVHPKADGRNDLRPLLQIVTNSPAELASIAGCYLGPLLKQALAYLFARQNVS
jgi:hypothetical protein